MKKIFLFLCTIFCTMILFSCGKISTLKFYEACLTGDEKIISAASCTTNCLAPVLKVLDDKYKDHSLLGEYKGLRECHIEPDWLLIYYIENNTLNIVLYLESEV